jgi:hypothetical protein
VPHRDYPSCVDPCAGTTRAETLPEISREKARRPDFSVAGHDVSGALRRRPCKSDRLQNFLDVPGVAAPEIEEGNARIAGNEFPGSIRVAFACFMEFLQIRLVAAHSKADEVQEPVGNAAHGGNDDAESFVRLTCDNIPDAPEAIGVGNAAAAEFVNFPTSFRQQNKAGPHAKRLMIAGGVQLVACFI